MCIRVIVHYSWNPDVTLCVEHGPPFLINFPDFTQTDNSNCRTQAMETYTIMQYNVCVHYLIRLIPRLGRMRIGECVFTTGEIGLM